MAGADGWRDVALTTVPVLVLVFVLRRVLDFGDDLVGLAATLALVIVVALIWGRVLRAARGR